MVLVEQFRRGSWFSGCRLWQLKPPAGIIYNDEGVESAARRKALEEAGCEIGEATALTAAP